MSIDVIQGRKAGLQRALGQTGLALSGLGLGGAPLGNLYQSVDAEAARAVVAAAYDRGIRYFDTAPLYGSGLSETRMGQALKAMPRQDYVLSSKVGWLLEDDASVRQDGPYVGLPGKRKRCDYSRDGVLRSLEASLQRLGLDRIDIVYIHDLDTACHGDRLPQRFREAMEGAWPALAELRRQGVIGAVGLGVNEWQVCEQALQHADMDCFLLAGRYSLLDQSALASFLPACQARDVGVVIGGPYNSGILATGPVEGARYDYAPAGPDILRRAGELQAICHHYDVPLAAAAIQFPTFHPSVISVVPGARTEQEMSLNMALYEQAIPAALWSDFKASGLLAAEAPVPA